MRMSAGAPSCALMRSSEAGSRRSFRALLLRQRGVAVWAAGALGGVGYEDGR